MTHVGFVFEKRASHLILAASSTNTHAFRFRMKPFLIELEPLQRWGIIPSQDGARRCSQHLLNDTDIAYPIQELPFTLAQQATLSRAVLTGCLGILVLYGRRDIQSSGRILPWKVSLHGFGVDRFLFANVCDIWRCWDDTPKSLGTSQYWHQRRYQGPLFCEVCSFAQAASRSCQTIGCLTQGVVHNWRRRKVTCSDFNTFLWGGYFWLNYICLILLHAWNIDWPISVVVRINLVFFFKAFWPSKFLQYNWSIESSNGSSGSTRSRTAQVTCRTRFQSSH